jgi:hypothetical protein
MTTNLSSVFVPTAQTAAISYFLDMMINLKKPIMLVGGAGVGKTQLVKGKLGGLDESFASLTINFNYFTDVVAFQKLLESKLEKKAGVNYGPPGNKNLIYFVDDLNMPMLDKYETAMPISLIRQHLGWGHWYDRQKLTIKNVNNCQVRKKNGKRLRKYMREEGGNRRREEGPPRRLISYSALCVPSTAAPYLPSSYLFFLHLSPLLPFSSHSTSVA